MPKSRTNVSIESAALEEARAYGLNVSAITERALTEALRAERARAWKAENAEALAARSQWIGENGMPLARWQSFKA